VAGAAAGAFAGAGVVTVVVVAGAPHAAATNRKSNRLWDNDRIMIL
jgi:hypothetical protein